MLPKIFDRARRRNIISEINWSTVAPPHMLIPLPSTLFCLTLKQFVLPRKKKILPILRKLQILYFPDFKNSIGMPSVKLSTCFLIFPRHWDLQLLPRDTKIQTLEGSQCKTSQIWPMNSSGRDKSRYETRVNTNQMHQKSSLPLQTEVSQVIADNK